MDWCAVDLRGFASEAWGVVFVGFLLCLVKKNLVLEREGVNLVGGCSEGVGCTCASVVFGLCMSEKNLCWCPGGWG